MSPRPEPLPLKDLVNFLFEHVQRPDGRPYTTQEVTDHVRISHATINQLRTGRSKNPALPTLQEICRFFEVPLTFFECTSYEECFAVLAEPRTEAAPQAAEIAFRASRLSPEAQDDLLKIILWVEAAERERKAGHDLPQFPLDEEDEP
jgi:transcriptional regulator with XRE-family HTH domain